MNEIPRFLIYVICAQFLFFAQASAQRASTGTAFSTTEFDLNAKSLPPLYKGHDIAQLSLKLAAKGKSKGEFETTEQWQQRLNKEESEPILGGLLLSSVYAFALGGLDNVGQPSGFDKPFEIRYDADSSTFDVQIESTRDAWDESGNPAGLKGYQCVVELASTYSESSFIGTNSYGATAEVTSKKSRIYAVEFSNARFVDGQNPIHGRFVAPVERAPTIKQNIGVLAVCKLKAPFYKTGHSSSTATIEMPYEYSDDYSYVITELLAFWVYNKTSGEVYTKIETPPAGEGLKLATIQTLNIPRLVQVHFSYSFKEATITFSGGGQTLFEENLKGKKVRGGLQGIKGSFQGTFSRTLTVPAGISEFSIRVIAKDGATDLSKAIKMSPPGGFVPTLAVEVDSDHLSLSWEGSSAAN